VLKPLWSWALPGSTPQASAMFVGPDRTSENTVDGPQSERPLEFGTLTPSRKPLIPRMFSPSGIMSGSSPSIPKAAGDFQALLRLRVSSLTDWML
jgi:hypothetical protein